MNLVYGKCIRIEDSVNPSQMEYLMNEMSADDILMLVFGSQQAGPEKKLVTDEQFSKDHNSKRITMMTDTFLFESSFETVSDECFMVVYMNLYNELIERNKVVNRYIELKEKLTEFW